MCLGDGPSVLSCKGCVCGLSVVSLLFGLIGFIVTGTSEAAFTSWCTRHSWVLADSGMLLGNDDSLLGYGTPPEMSSLDSFVTFLHQVRSETHLLEVGGLLEDLSALEAMKPPFLGHFKTAFKTAATTKPKPKPKSDFIDHINRIKSKTVELLAACPAQWKDESESYFSSLDSEDAMGLSKWIILAPELTASGLAASSAITKLKIRGRPSSGATATTGTQEFLNFEAGLKAVTYTSPGCGPGAAGGCGSATPTAAQFVARDADQYASPGTFTVKNKDSWSELTLTNSFIWDGTSNIEVSLFHGTDSATSSTSYEGLTTKQDTSISPLIQRGIYQTVATAPAGFETAAQRTWTLAAAASTNPFYSWMGLGTDNYEIPQIEFVTAGCTASSLMPKPACSSFQTCAACLVPDAGSAKCEYSDGSCGTYSSYGSSSQVTDAARCGKPDCDSFGAACAACLAPDAGSSTCKFQFGSCGNLVGTASEYETVDAAKCPVPCSSFKACHLCRNNTESSCNWIQSEASDAGGGPIPGSLLADTAPYCADTGDAIATGMERNYTCQSPEAVAKGLKTCKRVAGNYAIGYTGNIFVMIGAGAQLVGVCSWFPKPFGVGKEEHANTKVLCAGCNTHWIAGLVVMIWSISWFLRLNIVLAYAIAGGFVTPCLIGPVVGCMGLSSICPSKTCAGPMPEGMAESALQANPTMVQGVAMNNVSKGGVSE